MNYAISQPDEYFTSRQEVLEPPADPWTRQHLQEKKPGDYYAARSYVREPHNNLSAFNFARVPAKLALGTHVCRDLRI